MHQKKVYVKIISRYNNKILKLYYFQSYWITGDIETVQGITDGRKLAAKVAIHNLCNLTGLESQPLVYLRWPTPKKGSVGRIRKKLAKSKERLCR